MTQNGTPRLNLPLNDAEIFDLALDAMAAEYLVVDEKRMEARSYLVKTTLPSVVIALRQLLVEVVRRDALEKARSIVIPADDIQPDRPIVSFDSLRWLGSILLIIAQNLYRHGIESNCSYKDKVSVISVKLEERVFNLRAERERFIRAEIEEKARSDLFSTYLDDFFSLSLTYNRESTGNYLQANIFIEILDCVGTASEQIIALRENLQADLNLAGIATMDQSEFKIILYRCMFGWVEDTLKTLKYSIMDLILAKKGDGNSLTDLEGVDVKPNKVPSSL